MKYPPRKIFNAIAISGTATVKSKVVQTAEHDAFISGSTTSTATGVITVEFNDMDETDYNAACGVTVEVGPTEAQEAANTTGWKPLPVYYLVAGTMTTTGTIAQGAAGTFSVTVKRGKMRVRLSYTNATNSGAITAMSKENA